MEPKAEGTTGDKTIYDLCMNMCYSLCNIRQVRNLSAVINVLEILTLVTTHGHISIYYECETRGDKKGGISFLPV
jgi:hypothetical protein